VQSAEINEKFSDLHPDIFRSLWKFIYYATRISLNFPIRAKGNYANGSEMVKLSLN